MKMLSYLFVMICAGCVCAIIILGCYTARRRKKSETKGVDEKQYRLYIMIELFTVCFLLSAFFYTLIQRVCFSDYATSTFWRGLIPSTIIFYCVERWSKSLRTQLDSKCGVNDEK